MNKKTNKQTNKQPSLIKRGFRRFFLINDNPHKVAAGAALGVFLGIFPGEGVVSSLILSSVLKVNGLAATIGVLATNMWTTVVFLPFGAMIGAVLFGKEYPSLLADYKEGMHLGIAYFFGKVVFLELTLPLLVGFLVVSLLAAFGFYVILYILLLAEHRKKEHLFLTGEKSNAFRKRKFQI